MKAKDNLSIFDMFLTCNQLGKYSCDLAGFINKAKEEDGWDFEDTVTVHVPLGILENLRETLIESSHMLEFMGQKKLKDIEW